MSFGRFCDQQVRDDGSVMFGYSAFPLYDQAVEEFKMRDPNQARLYDKLFGDQNPQGRA